MSKKYDPALEPGKLAYRIENAAKAADTPRTALYEAIADGRLRSYKVGRGRYVSAVALREFIAAREAEALA